MKNEPNYLNYLKMASGPRWYWKDGTPIMPKGTKTGSRRWIKAMREMNDKLKDKDYKLVAATRLWWGGAVSTVWLGLDHNLFFSDPNHPLIFETMVFPPNSYMDLDMDRYSTEAEAKKGHDEMVRRWRSPLFCLKRLFSKLGRLTPWKK